LEDIIYTGIKNVQMSDQELADFYENKNPSSNIFGMKLNEYIIVKNKNGEIVDKQKFTKDGFKKLTYIKLKDFKPLSVKQECAFDLLSNTAIPIKILGGVPGAGKTAIAIRYGMYYLLKQTYSNILVVRHNVGVGEKNGFLPGDKYEKLRGWLGFLEDNLDFTQYTVDEMFDRKMLSVDGVEYMKGRDIKNTFIIIDEAEDLTTEQFKMIGERVSANSTICFIGDQNQTTQEKYQNNNGLKRAIESLAGNPLVGMIVFDDKLMDNMRSETSKVFSYYYGREG
jgi:predicted ribonuclease YlaK